MAKQQLEVLNMDLNRDVFLRNLLRELSGTLETVVGLEQARGFVTVVGQKIGSQLNDDYREALKTSPLDRELVAQVLVDLKRRIQGDFTVVEATAQRITLENTTCPFGDKVIGRTSLCMMTSNVFGVIAAENLGYAKVVLEKTIANGQNGCRVVVHLHPTDDETDDDRTREYFGEN